MHNWSNLYVVAIPALGGIDDETRQEIRDWYEQHKFTYAKVWDRLDQIRDLWALYDHDERVALLKCSYIFTLMTQQTATHRAEEVFRRIMAGMSVREARSVPFAGKKPGKEMQYTAWVYDSFASDHWEEVVELLDSGKTDDAHKLLVDQTKGLRATKAGFVLANLGRVHKMCVDSNVAALLDAQHPDPEKELKNLQPETVDVSKYDQFCGEIQNFFPELSEALEPYHLQWLLFDFQRFHKRGRGKSVGVTEDMAVATHDEWFEVALGDINHVKARMGTITIQAEMVHMSLAASPYSDEENEGADDLTALQTSEDGGEKLRDVLDDGFGEGQDDRDASTESVEDPIRATIERDLEQAVDEGITREGIGRDLEQAIREAEAGAE